MAMTCKLQLDEVLQLRGNKWLVTMYENHVDRMIKLESCG